MSLEVKNFIDYFVICGLDIKNGLEPEPNEAYYGINNKKLFKFSFNNML
jgi:hypothetical protein